MINWKDPKVELPEDGQHVAAMQYHWKKCWPLSAGIIFGECESYIDEDGIRIASVNTCDFTGQGSSFWNFPNKYYVADYIVAWAYASDFKRPEFIVHDTHWGSEK